MGIYRVAERSFIDGHLREVGDTVEFSGIPGFNLEPEDDAAKKAKKAAGESASRNVNTSDFVRTMAVGSGEPPGSND